MKKCCHAYAYFHVQYHMWELSNEVLYRVFGGSKILVWQVEINLWNISMADNSKFLKCWHGSCHTLPPGSNGPAVWRSTSRGIRFTRSLCKTFPKSLFLFIKVESLNLRPVAVLMPLEIKCHIIPHEKALTSIEY